MDPFDVIKSLIPGLTEKQKSELLSLLGVSISICEKSGHKFKPVGKPVSGFYWGKRVTMCCERCGLTFQAKA